MDKRFKKILGKTLIGVLALMFVLFLSVPVAQGYTSTEYVQDGRTEVTVDSSGKEIFMYAMKELGGGTGITMAKRDGNTISLARNTAISPTLSAQTKTEMIREADDKYQSLVVTTGETASLALKAVINLNPNWATGNLSYGAAWTIMESNTVTMNNADAAYYSGNNWVVLYVDTNDFNKLKMVTVNTVTETGSSPYNVKKETAAGWVDVTAADPAYVSVDAVNANEVAAVWTDPVNGSYVVGARVCVVADCPDIAPGGDEYGYILSTPAGATYKEPLTIESSFGNTNLDVNTIGVTASEDTQVSWINANGQGVYKKTDFISTSSSLTVYDEATVVDFNASDPDLVGAVKKVAYILSTANKTISASVDANNLTKVTSDLETGVSPKMVGVGVTDSVNDKSTLITGTTDTIKTTNSTLGIDPGGLLLMESLGGGGAVIPEFPTKWVAVLVGAVALIAVVGIASWMKKKEAK